MSQFETLLVNMFEQGVLFAFLGLGIRITFFCFPDLTAEGSYPLGGAVAAALLVFRALFSLGGEGGVRGRRTVLMLSAPAARA